MDNRSFRDVPQHTTDDLGALPPEQAARCGCPLAPGRPGASPPPPAESVSWLHSAVAPSPCCIYIKDSTGRYIMANPAAAAALALSEEDLCGLSDADLAGLGRMTEAEAAQLAAADERVRATGRPLAIEEQFTIAERPRRFHSFKSPTLGEWCPGGVLGISIDLAGPHRPVAQGRHDERYRVFFDACDDAVLVQHVDGTVLDCNPAASLMYGYARDELIGLHAADLVPPSEHMRMQGWRTLLERTGKIFVHSLGTDRTGRVFPTEVSSHTIDLGGETVLMVQVRDISDRRRLEEQLRQAHKMEAVGRLAGGIAHEFNNLLTVINGYSEFLLRSLDTAGETYEDVEQIYAAGCRAAELTRQLLAFSRRQALARPLVNVNTVIGEMGELLRSLAPESVHLSTHLAPDLGLTRGDRGQIEQLIVHLALNARDAMPQGGELSICTANVTLRPGDRVSHLDPQPGEYVCLAVGDTGVGMSAEICTHLFEPFFTTKEVGRGTGLGLAMIYGVIGDLGGAIDVRSTLGRGSTFRLYLPRVSEVENDARPGDDALPHGSETVVVVDDQEPSRRQLADLLRRLGYTTLEAAGGTEALRTVTGRTAPVDLIIAAHALPDASGAELIAQVRTLYAQMPAILVAPEDAEALPILEADAVFPLIRQPLTPDIVARQLRRVLGASRNPSSARYGTGGGQAPPSAGRTQTPTSTDPP